MTATMHAIFPLESPARWNVLFAQDSDTDLDFDEGFEEDELHQSKPPSHRPLLWIILLVLVGAIAYWTFNDPSPQRPRTAAIESLEGTNSALQVDAHMDIASPLFREDQTVSPPLHWR